MEHTKISHYGTNNIFEIIYYYKKNLVDKSLIDNQRTNKSLCNCKINCPIGRMCKPEKVFYQATIFLMKNRKKEWVYIGISCGNWEQRLYNRKHFLLYWSWSLRDKDITPQLKWEFIKKSSTLGRFNSRCKLSREEKKHHSI